MGKTTIAAFFAALASDKIFPNFPFGHKVGKG